MGLGSEIVTQDRMKEALPYLHSTAQYREAEKEKERMESIRSLVLKWRITATITKNYSMPTRSNMKSTFFK
jgi:hypothetical protein